MEYKISVIIPVFNAEKYLKTAIESVINQTFGFENIELIIVNDCSTDNTKEIIEEYFEKYDNIVGIHLAKNSGYPGKPRNVGIKQASAPYLIFLDADDQYVDNAFELYYKTIVQEKSDFVMGSHYWNMDGDMMKMNILHECDDASNIININPMLNEENFSRTTYYHVSPWGKIFNKKLIIDNDIEFLEDSLSEDAYFYYKILLNSKKITLLPNDELYIYNVYDTNESTIHTHTLKSFNDFLNGFYEVINLFSNVTFSKVHPYNSSFQSLLLMFSNLNRDEKKECINKLFELQILIKDDLDIQLKELKFISLLISKKYFKLAILVSDGYSFLYNNSFIRKIYRKFR